MGIFVVVLVTPCVVLVIRIFVLLAWLINHDLEYRCLICWERKIPFVG